MSRVSKTDSGAADYVLELDQSDVDSLKRAAKAADGSLSPVQQARRTLRTGVSENTDGLADAVMTLDADELDALRETALDADGRKTEVKRARDILGVRNAR